MQERDREKKKEREEVDGGTFWLREEDSKFQHSLGDLGKTVSKLKKGRVEAGDVAQ